MATFLANEINASDRYVTSPTTQVQIMSPLKDKNINWYCKVFEAIFSGTWMNKQSKKVELGVI